jgi:hypothetical protein
LRLLISYSIEALVKKASKIQVYEFESLATYLRAEIYRRKQDGRGFSMLSLSERIGISPSLLTLVLKGKRKLTPSVPSHWPMPCS